ncbi:MAG TPA: type II toxin-antitoxin system death-on-curing family toxin [Thermoanaerobaculia bacterium]
MREPVRVRDDVVLAIHHRQLAEHCGGEGIRDPGLLDSALAGAKNLLADSTEEPDLALLAAAYAWSLARNHPFVDGNKRTAYVVCRSFLRLNGRDLDASPEEKYLTFLRLAEGRLTEQALAAWIREHLAGA